MFAGAHAETGDERNAATLLPHVIGNLQAAAGCGALSRAATSDCAGTNRPFASLRGRVHVRGFGMQWLVALTFAMVKEAEAADPNVLFLDDGSIKYRDMEHGTFELITKEPIPRHYFVEDPGETIVLRTEGSSVNVRHVTNSSARMAELEAAQQDALAILAKGQDSSGSSTPPLIDPLPVQPINFSETDGLPGQNSLAPIPSLVIPIIEIIVGRPPPLPPTLHAVAGPTEIDTAVFDQFTATSGTFVASSADGNATLTFGISGGTIGSTELGGATYDVSRAGPYGTLYVNSATGAYTFVPDSGAINALTEPTTTSFTVTVSDGSLAADQAFTIAINGTNDAAIISGAAAGSAVEASGLANTTQGTPTSGMLADTDVDNTPNTFTPVSSPTASTGGHGTFTMTAAGVWTYAPDETNSAVQALNVGGALTDTFTVTTVDGTAQMITVTIHGANDAAVISGAMTGAVIEADYAKYGTLTATGTLTDTDVDNTPNTFTPVCSPTASAGGHGSYTMTTAGVWTYTLDDCSGAVQALNFGDMLTDSFTVTTLDGTAQVVTVTVHGTNDAAVISGDTTGSVIEAGCHEYGKPIACGKLTDTDVDNTPNTFTPVSSPAASTGGYGSFTMTAAGEWTYTLDNSDGAVQALNKCDTLTDCFTVTTVDGTAQVIKVTIHGTNDAAVISGTTTGSVIEAGCDEYGKPIACGTLTDTDVDNTPNTFTPVCSPSAGGYGSYTMTAAGVWTYKLDNTNCTVQALNSCDTLTDCFTVTTVDGTDQVVKITIHGTTDGYDFKAWAARSQEIPDSFQFNDGMSGLDGSGVIGPADVDFASAPLSLGEDAEGVQAIGLSLPGQPAAGDLSIIPEPAAVALHAPHDLVV